MDRAASTLLLWCGRLFVLLAVLILVAALFLPDAVQPLNSVVCPTGTELANARYTPRGAPNNEKLELVCTSPTYTESAARMIMLVVGGLAVVGIFSIWFSTRLRQRPMTRPQVPAHH
jgi:hypothetical protein